MSNYDVHSNLSMILKPNEHRTLSKVPSCTEVCLDNKNRRDKMFAEYRSVWYWTDVNDHYYRRFYYHTEEPEIFENYGPDYPEYDPNQIIPKSELFDHRLSHQLDDAIKIIELFANPYFDFLKFPEKLIKSWYRRIFRIENGNLEGTAKFIRIEDNKTMMELEFENGLLVKILNYFQEEVYEVEFNRKLGGKKVNYNYMLKRSDDLIISKYGQEFFDSLIKS